MSYNTHYERFKELVETYKIRVGTYGLIPDDVPPTERERSLISAIEEYDVVVEPAGVGYGHTKYRVLHNAPGLSAEDLAIICDRGNLCFGYRKEGGYIVVYTD